MVEVYFIHLSILRILRVLAVPKDEVLPVLGVTRSTDPLKYLKYNSILQAVVVNPEILRV